jgi:cell surface protein SprA
VRKGFRHIVWLGISLFCFHFSGLGQTTVLNDTISRFPVSKTVPQEYEDLKKNPPAELRDPENIKRTIEYDLKTGMYIVRTKIGDMELGTPLTLTPEQYREFSFEESMRSFYRRMNDENFNNSESGKINLSDLQFNIEAADKIFGPGGVRVTSQGSGEIKMGFKNSNTKNPSLPERSRNRTFFSFDTDVQLNMRAGVGTKVNFNLNYNTQASFDFDATRLGLRYQGEEDEIIKNIEAGNVALNTGNSLIRGGVSLFGIKTELQFGKLRINALLAQQEGQSRTVTTKGGAQTTDFEINIDQYDDSRHFFLSFYFRENYDQALNKMPYIASGVIINRIEVWITNKRGNYNQSRNIVAFTDLGEYDHISNSQFSPSGMIKTPYNDANTLYKTLEEYSDARDISKVNQVFNGFLSGGLDYEKVESARRLDNNEYFINKQLGYISLQQQLQPDEILGVAYEYTYNGTVYQVGEFSTDKTNQMTDCLYLKLLKGTSMSPSMPFWDLMMKNVYSLNALSVQKDRFRMDILYKNDTIGTYINYIQDGRIENNILLRVMNLDRLDIKNEPHPDGFFDFIDNITIQPANGKIVFPVVEPFGSHLRKMIGDDAIADKYVFQELYDSTKTVAQQIAEKNKFILRGEYRASSTNEISLGATNVQRGTVVVRAGGAILQENVDYTVDYISGYVKILNESISASNTPIQATLEDRSTFNMQRKTMMGLDMSYEFSKDLIMGATIMHLSEMPLTTKTSFGNESLKNTLWGANISYKGESRFLTTMLDKIPFLELTQPSRINFNAEFAHLIAGHYESKYTGKYSYIDDFEYTQRGFDLLNPYPWTLSSVPDDKENNKNEFPRFPEATLVNNIDYGKNRALFAWYYIDGLFTRKNSSMRPTYMSDDDLSNHYVRAVDYTELFPKKDLTYNENSSQFVLNMAYYPNERGPYNLDATQINPDGTLMNPEKRWGGMMRKIDQSDFEVSNVEYIEFWLMDPFIYNHATTEGGDLYFNLGDISEDILKDEKKFFENGLPVQANALNMDDLVETTVWGRVPRQQSTVYAFDNTAGARKMQDVGLNGLSENDEKTFPAYANYLAELEQRLSTETINQMKNDPLALSPFFSPSGDKYHYFRGSDYDNLQLGILERYKYYNGTEGNSTASEDSPERYDVSAKMIPDVEDINQDNTLNENEKYYEYKVSLRPDDMEEGQNYIVNKRTVKVRLMNGTESDINWYLFKIPVKEYERKIGNIQDFKTIRFMRVFMTGFKETTILRFGTFSLKSGDWRIYSQSLAAPNTVSSGGRLDVTTVNIEENGDKKPVNSVLPPGVTRMIDPSQTQIVQQNEQALSMKLSYLGSQDARAVYRTTNYDLRRYKRMQLFVHAERSISDTETDLRNGDFSVFLRLGTDYKNNYYEYEVPLELTPPGVYKDDERGREAVWPVSNMLDFRFEVLTDLKTKRNRARSEGQAGANYNTVFSDYDPDNKQNKISVIGNPSIAEVKTIMIGVRNNSKDIQSGEVWINELRLTDFDERGGWAANGNLTVALSDLGTVNASGRIETVGFGGLDQSVNERNLNDHAQYAISANIQLGKFFPEKAYVNLPLYYAYSKETTSPQYNPLDQDILLKNALDMVETKNEKDSIKSFSQDQTIVKSLAFNNVKVGVKSKNPMPYDPDNFTISYAFSENKRNNPETEYETTKRYQGNLAYSYMPYFKPFTPFSQLEKNNGYTRYIKQLSINYLPQSISFQTSMMRNYYEIQLRNLENIGRGIGTKIDPSFKQEFYWDRAFSIRWSLLSNLSIDFTSNTQARIEEPYGQVNKQLNPDAYAVWKSEVLKSIADLGVPLVYDQKFNITYAPSFQQIPVLEWINASATFNTTYNWERGAYIDPDIQIGNTITNQRQFSGNVGFILQTLYNKNSFLKSVNQKYATTATPNRRPQNTQNRNLKYEETITLSPDSGVIVTHPLASKNLRVTARVDSSDAVYRVRFTALDFARIRILNQDTNSLKIKLTVVPGPPPTENFLYKAAEYSARFLMMLRNVRIQYSATDGTRLPGFLPTIGDWLGQAGTPFGNAPGWGFAFGRVSENFVKEAVNNQWMLVQKSNQEEEFYGNMLPAMINNMKTLNATATIEPAVGFKIDLTANRTDSRDTEIRFMYSGMPTTYGGNFMMTTVALNSLFASSGDVRNGYASKPFQQFLANRAIIASRLEKNYSGTNYPTNGFLEGTNFGVYNPERFGGIRENSTDVLIPAFLAAYTGKNANKSGLTAFPSITNLLPNWRITYDGLIQLPFIKKHFRSVSISHVYSCRYSVGAYNSYLNWVDAGNNMGFVRDVITGNPLPGSAFDISSVSITEQFSPLIGIDATFINNVTLSAKIQKTRNLNLNMASYQIVETFQDDFTLSLGYKFAEFNKILKLKKKSDFSNDLTIRFDLSNRTNQSLIRKIEDGYTQMTQGAKTRSFQFSADYAFSQAVTLRAFYDLQTNQPLVSSNSFPTSNSNYGLSIRLSLAQ